jgi:hypothetical protein
MSEEQTGPYGPLTKSIDVDEALMLIDLTRVLASVSEWQEEALHRLPQASRQRREEIVRSVRRMFLKIEEDRFVATPLVALLTARAVDGRLKRDLLCAQYLRTTPLVWEAIQQVVLPHAEAGARPLAKDDESEISQAEWDALLSRRLRQYTDTTFSRTRNHITAHLIKFGLLEARSVPGDRFDKQFVAHFYEPDPGAFWFSLAVEFVEQGWTSRSLDFITGASWTRIAYCTKTSYARFIMEEAERRGLVVTDFYGAEKQVTFPGRNPVAGVVEAIHGSR